MTTSTKVIILRCIDYQESSRIITVLSPVHGKIALIARGVKRPKNKLAGLIEVGNILEVVYYYKATRNVHTLAEAVIEYHSHSFRSDLAKASVLYASLELINQLSHENETNPRLFEFCRRLIIWLGERESAGLEVFPYIQIRLAQLTGFGIIDACANSAAEAYLNISGGSVADEADSELSYKLTAAQKRYLTMALHTRRNEIFNLGLDNGELKQLIHHLDVYFKYHVEGYKERRSDSIFEQMMI